MLRPRSVTGFTLIEVMVALAIVAFSLTAIAASMNQMIDAANSMRERTYASWIAQNKIAELRLANITPEVSSTSGEVDYANSQWSWRAVVSETGIESFYRVDVSVSHAGSDYQVRTVTGFIGEPLPVGRANQVWNRGLRASGATN
ncbi:MAG: type II secretion system minor pseudopilin GspI [Gammaproteobacteria bacterium]|nr:type II secretion system minor pseudopilin GspI [Gammaproteobacteria bacterium]